MADWGRLYSCDINSPSHNLRDLRPELENRLKAGTLLPVQQKLLLLLCTIRIFDQIKKKYTSHRLR